MESGRLPLDPAENPAAVITFDAMAARLIKSEEGKLQRGELTKISFDNLVYRMNKTILPHFKGKDLRSINYALLNEYLTKLSGQKESLSLSTIGAYMGLVRKVLLHAVRESHLDQVPEFPKVGVEDRPRGWFRVAEYSLLYRTAKKLANKTIEWRVKSQGEGSYYCLPGRREHPDDRLIRRIEISPDLNDVIVFMVNSYIRPTDLKHMQHRHVQVVRREFTYLRLTLPPSKGHSFPITTMPWAVKVYERIRARRLKASGGKDIPINEYVFYPEYTNRDYALKQIQRQFEVLLAITGLRVKGVKEQDNDRTLYSLRHSSIMFRLLYGQAIDTLTLARNARTSPEMIDRFYAAPLQGEMNIDKLQSKRRPRPWEVGQGGRQSAGSDDSSASIQ